MPWWISMARPKGFCWCPAYSSNYGTPTCKRPPSTIFFYKRVGHFIDKFGMTRETRGFSFTSIIYYIVQFTAKFLSRNLLWNIQPDKCTAGTIDATELCATGVQLNLSQYLLNELLAVVEEEKEKGITFHYSWILIMISCVAWAEPTNYEGVDVPVLCRGARYQNL